MKRPGLIALAFLLIAFLGFGLFHLFSLQFEKGNQYPPYSTLRSDPMGAKLLFETLQQWSHHQTGQILNRIWEKPHGKNATWILLDVQESRMLFNKMEGAGLHEFLQQGGRVVIAFQAGESFKTRPAPSSETISSSIEKTDPSTPQNQPPPSTPEENPPETATDRSPEKIAADEIQKKAEAARKEREEAEQERERYLQKTFEDFEKEWGYEIASNPLLITAGEEKGKQKPQPALALDLWNGETLPEIPWRSTNYFIVGNPAWKIRYTVDGKPVIIEREMNGGSVVLLTDPSLMSNEALLKGDHWQPLLPILGVGRSYWFDETHLKVMRHLSLMQLIDRFHGSGLLLGILMTFLLWVWKNQSILAPLPIPRDERSRKISTPLQNLTQLFQRNLRLPELWNEMIREWTVHHQGEEGDARANQARKHLQTRLRQKPLPHHATLYREVTEILNERKNHGNAT